MRLVAVADTHLYHRELVVPEGDVFVHAGDLCRAGDLDELRTCVAWIGELPHPTKIVIAGNHDACFESTTDGAAARALLDDHGILYLEDSLATVDGVTFWGSPWQPAFNDWAFNLPRGAPLAAKWALIPPRIDVLVTHGPPAGIGDRGPTAGRLGCADLRSRVKAIKPLLHLFGHIHQDGGFWEHDGIAFANVTTWECERPPTVIDLALDTRNVRPVSIPPASR